MSAAHWASAYVGIPYAEFGHDEQGCNCWGLVVLVYGAAFGIRLPTYHGCYASIEERREIAGLLDNERGSPSWRRVTEARPGDVAVFRRGALETHVGLVIDPGRMLHVTADDQSKIESYTTGAWKHRLTGIYRHTDRIDHP
ncbi:NlpC/P60 family protein [Rhizobium sp. CSW-27]|uniref:C40 family peptidase n=1 Tax=Rhizobium sp. CSW-27 TaxID=2839985 RepID=UPI001C017908|nr:NlpC/P60 family protein [Rhizobium sp. CSW-27]MBT9370268.1 C40 family peptidase [Rhizobium sp. CSW-27]